MKKPQQEPIGYTVSGLVALAGGTGAVAKACGVSVQSVNKWTSRIPAIHARAVAILCGLPIEVIRPDMVRYDYNQQLQTVKEE